EELPTKAAQEDLSSIRHAGHEWVSQLKLAHEVSGICSDSTDPSKDHQRPVPISVPIPNQLRIWEYSRNQPQRSDSSRQGQYTQRDGLGNHHCIISLVRKPRGIEYTRSPHCL